MQKHYLSPEEETAIRAMREEGHKMLAIAKKFEISQATVSNVINGRHKLRGTSPRRRACKPVRPLPEPGLVVQDFSSLPDHVLFQHVREWDFIG